MDVHSPRVLLLSFYREGSRSIASLAAESSYLITGPTEPCTHISFVEGTYPQLHARSFENVEAVGCSSALLRVNTVYIPDYYEVQEHAVVNESFFLVEYIPEGVALIYGGVRPQAGNGIMLFQIGAFNWYHWLIEILPMAFLAERLPDQYASYPFVIPDRIAQIKSFRDSLELFLHGRSIRVIEKDGLTFSDLIVIDPIANGPFNLRRGFWPDKEAFSYNGTLLLEFRHAILDRLRIQMNNQSDLIFLARENDRREFNQSEIQNIAIRHGFRLVYMERLSFREQVELLFGAKVVVGPSGAAFANILFCQQGARILSWLLPQYKGFSSFSNLAQTIGAQMRYIFSEPRQPVESTGDAYEAKYHLDPVVFENALTLAVHSRNY